MSEREGETVRPTRVLVTGANGFIGSKVAALCALEGMEVRTTGRTLRDSSGLPNYFPADVTEAGSLKETLSGVDAVVHAAGLAHQFDKASDDAPFHAVNVVGTQNAARAAVEAGVGHFVLLSSVSVYGERGEGICDESALCRPVGAYAESKLLAELRAAEIFSGTGKCLTILRLATVYGEGDRGNVARLMRSIDRGRFVWVGRGENFKSLIHCDDVARACLAVLQAPCGGTNVYNVSAPASKMREIVDEIYLALGKSPARLAVPAGAALGLAGFLSKLAPAGSKPLRLKATLEKWLKDDAYDGGRFERRFAFQPQVTLADGLRREATWYRASVR